MSQTMNDEDADRLDEFMEVDADDMNGEYLEFIVDSHQEMFDEMEDDLEEAGDNDAWGIAAWINKTMPKMAMHKKKAEELKDMSPKAN